MTGVFRELMLGTLREGSAECGDRDHSSRSPLLLA
jgi:hypothetical protein